MVEIEADMDASVWQVLVEPGVEVDAGQELIILESMKMEIPVVAPCDGIVAEVRVEDGQSVKRGAVLAVITRR